MSALAPPGGAPPVAKQTPEVVSWSKLWEPSSTSMLEWSPLGVALSLESATLALGAWKDPLDDDTAKDRVDKTSNAQRNCFRYFSGLLFVKFFT